MAGRTSRVRLQAPPIARAALEAVAAVLPTLVTALVSAFAAYLPQALSLALAAFLTHIVSGAIVLAADDDADYVARSRERDFVAKALRRRRSMWPRQVSQRR